MNINASVFYLMSGQAHLPYLVVSLSSLRAVWTGPIHVCAWQESYDLVCRIAEDKRLNISASFRDPAYRGKNDQFLDKIQMMSGVKHYDVGLYLDADTYVRGPIEPLLKLALTSPCGFTATQFNNWMMNSKRIHNRINGILSYMPQFHQDHVHKCLKKECTRPSVNGGVFAARPGSAVLRDWYYLTYEARTTFIADEVVLHTLLEKHNIPVADGMYNSSPKYYKHPADKIAIWHFHGDSNVRPDKSQFGYNLWWPLYQKCLDENIGFVQEWHDKIGNKWINQLRDSYAAPPI